MPIPEDWEGDPQQGFIKGDLARVGALQLLSDFDRVAFRAGFQRIERRWFTQFAAELDIKFFEKAVRVGLTAPLRFLFLDEDAPVEEAYQGFHGRLRDEDWDEAGDFFKLLHYLAIGGKEQEFFLSVGRMQPVTIGHGALVRRYSANLDVDHTRTTLEIDVYNPLFGMEGFIGDVTSPTVMGGIFFVKPGALIGPGRPLERLSIGVSAASDASAPRSLHTVERDGTMTFDVDPAGNPRFSEQAVTAMGVDAEIKVLRTADADLKPYVDHSWLLGHGSGSSLGLLARFNFGQELRSALRLRAEARTHEADYLPGYFDTLYEFQRYQHVTAAHHGQHGFVPTRLVWLESQAGGPRGWGYYLEGSFSLPGYFALSAAIEDSTAPYSKSLMLHAEIPANRYLTFFLTYHRRHVGSFGVPFVFEEDTEVFFWAWRIKLLPILAINYRSQRAFEVNRDARSVTDRLFDNVFHFSADIELGYEF